MVQWGVFFTVSMTKNEQILLHPRSVGVVLESSARYMYYYLAILYSVCPDVLFYFLLLIELWCSRVSFYNVSDNKIEIMITLSVSGGCSEECHKVHEGLLLYSMCPDVLICLIFRLNYGVVGCLLDDSDSKKLESATRYIYYYIACASMYKFG